MRKILLAVGLILLSIPAYAQHYCGHDVEPPLNSSYVLPNGAVANNARGIPVYGAGDGSGGGLPGAAWQSQHRYCGEIAVYVYTGDNPINGLWFTVQLDPTIVKPTANSTKCTVDLGQSADVYYYGYSDPFVFPDGQRADVMAPSYDGTYIYANVYVHGGGYLQPRSVYAVFMNCPPNL